MQFLGAKSTSILDCVGPSVRPSVRPPRCAITWKTRVTSRLLREEEEEETDYVVYEESEKKFKKVPKKFIRC
jgi:hypothetical protein